MGCFGSKKKASPIPELKKETSPTEKSQEEASSPTRKLEQELAQLIKTKAEIKQRQQNLELQIKQVQTAIAACVGPKQQSKVSSLLRNLKQLEDEVETCKKQLRNTEQRLSDIRMATLEEVMRDAEVYVQRLKTKQSMHTANTFSKDTQANQDTIQQTEEALTKNWTEEPELPKQLDDLEPEEEVKFDALATYEEATEMHLWNK